MKTITTQSDYLGEATQTGGVIRRVLCLLALGLIVALPTDALADEKPSKPAATMPVKVDPKTATLSESITNFGAAVQANDLKLAQRWMKDQEDQKESLELKKHWAGITAQHKEFGYEIWIKEALERENRPADAKIPPREKPNEFTVGGHRYNHLHIYWEKGKDGWRIGGFFICR